MENYRKYHEEFMQNQNGTSSWETLSLIVPSFFEVVIATITASIILSNQPNLSKVKYVIYHFMIDFLIIIIPLILAVTYLENYASYWLLIVFVLTISLILVLYAKIEFKTAVDSVPNKKPFITNARSTITVISIIAILAVDFQIFPRRFAKTEYYGYSLMDVGVGLFIFSNGIVAPEINRKPQSFVKALTSSTPLWILGTARFLITKELDYQAPVGEYGLHWNFFITLAVTKIVSSAILTIVDVNHSLFISIFLFCLHECLLHNGLGNLVLSSTPRDTFLLANKEGIVSSLGYVGLYFLSVHFGKMLKNSNSDFNLGMKLFSSSGILLISTILLERYAGISRRLANSAYCVWIMFIGIFMVCLFHCGETVVRKVYNAKWKYKIVVPIIFEAVNFNGLGFFLLGNVLTGLINISVHTLTVEPFLSFIIIVFYMFVTCSITTILFVNNIKLKIW